MHKTAVAITMGIALLSFLCADAHAQSILYLTKSSGFEHGAVKRDGDKLGIGEKVISDLARDNGVEITVTKDASTINAENLKKYDLVIFYTTGDLTKPSEGGRDEPPMGPNGVQELTQWIENGGGFIGIHAATDTFMAPEGQPASPYTQLIGGRFAGHGKQFEGTVRVVDPNHPTMQSLPKEWKLMEEWYMFADLDTKNMHVLALLDPGAERQKQDKYNIPAYPIIWCKTLGQGRIYYNGLGHNDGVWNDPLFQASIVDAAQWALGDTAAEAEPNYDKVVPKDIPAAEAPAAAPAEQK